MKKRTKANLIMIAIIALIAITGILGVGSIQGWFDADDGTQAVLQDIRGIIDLMRDGVSYPVGNNTVLRSGDKLTCQSGATATIRFGDDLLGIGEKAMLTVTDPSADQFSAEVHSGEVFAHCESGAALHFDGKQITVRGATVLLSVRSGAQSVSVFRGTVEDASAGQLLSYIDQEKTVDTLALASLNDFTITQIRNLNSDSLCFTAADLDRLAAERQQAIQDLINSQTTPTEADTSTGPTVVIQTTPAEPSVPLETTPVMKPPVPTTPGETTAPTEPAQTTPPPETTTPAETTLPTEATTPLETTLPPASYSCTIAIYCNTILDNMGDLEAGKAEFVPGDGMILTPVTVTFTDGETVFDVLKRVCDTAGIQLEYSWTPMYDSYYVEGINNLYEFDCGFESGWMYKVNGWFPNYGCSSYTLKDGDVIVWAYTCKGLGTDVGAPRME